jgi:formylglycine-generating enzyme required for sulfatase activity
LTAGLVVGKMNVQFTERDGMKSTLGLLATLFAAITVPTLAWAADPATPATQSDAKATTQPAKTLTLDLGNKVTMKLVQIPAGKFLMGSPDSEQKEAAKSAAASGLKEEDVKKWFENESPQHEVTISKAYYMGIYDVTQEQYEQVMGKNPSQFKGAKNPVETVSWDDAREFCKKLSAKAGKTVQLPTEAQWEYACRAGTKTPFNTGETISTDQANYNGNYVYGNGAKGEYRQKTTPVGTFKPNAFGLYDMHGNVWQWCADRYDEKYYGNSPKADPTGPADGNARVLRGGSWCYNPLHCRSAFRYLSSPDYRFIIGFRVVVAEGVD